MLPDEPETISSGSARSRHIGSFDDEELKAAFTERTRAIINTPNNPTGKVFDGRELSYIATVASGRTCGRSLNAQRHEKLLAARSPV
jgi:hypothetical protein